MSDLGMDQRGLLESLLSLSDEAELEVRVLSSRAAAVELSPTESAACRVGDRIWVVLNPDDPEGHQAKVLASALGKFRSEFLEDRFLAPAVRDFIDRVDREER
jgi:hypothetical protein